MNGLTLPSPVHMDGRYDSTYEEQGIDYPIGYIHFTEGRNVRNLSDWLANAVQISLTSLPM